MLCINLGHVYVVQMRLSCITSALQHFLTRELTPFLLLVILRRFEVIKNYSTLLNVVMLQFVLYFLITRNFFSNESCSSITTCAVNAFSVVLNDQTWTSCTRCTWLTLVMVFSISSSSIPGDTQSMIILKLSASKRRLTENNRKHYHETNKRVEPIKMCVRNNNACNYNN